jgi:WD40 repeat protein/tRNA A-37 threonylcarbamoyl transferase component Bud32
MAMAEADQNTAAEEIFAEFLDQVEAGETADFGALCEQHPEHRQRLERMHVRWLAMTQAFSVLQSDGKTPPPSSTLAELRQRIAGRGTRYKLGAEINRGAMGSIVAAFDLDLHRRVAIKVHRGPLNDERRQRRFLQEAQIAAQLDHPGIVPIHSVGFDEDGRPYFSMQLVRGRDLGAILLDARDGRDGWTRTRVLLVLLRVCEAMAFAHDKGVVHRDLKPQNIMVGRFGETYVMDWGLARVTGSSDDNAGSEVATLRSDLVAEGADALLTQDGDIVGTPAYMAPEQAASGGSAAASPPVDIYAVGAILYHLLANHMPYAGVDERADAVLQRLRHGPPTPLADDVPAELRAICQRAMARDAIGRYPDMAALADDLRAFVEVRTVRAYATGRFAELRKWIARNRLLAATAALLVLALGVGSVAVTRFWLQAVGDRDRADSTAVTLQKELERSNFRSARLALQSENSQGAADALWRNHLLGGLPRATAWALRELAEHDPYLATIPAAAADRFGRPVALVPPRDVAIVGGMDGNLRIHDATSLAVRATIPGVAQTIECVAWLPGTTCVVAGCNDGQVLVFDLEQSKLVRQSKPHTPGESRMLMLPVSSNGAFATSGGDRRVLWWSNVDAEPTEILRLDHDIASLAAGPDGAILVGDRNGYLHGRSPNGAWKYERKLLNAQLTAVYLDPDGHTLWAGGNDHTVNLLDIVDATVSKSWPSRNGTCRSLLPDLNGAMLVGGWWRTDRIDARAERTTPVSLRGPGFSAIDSQNRRLFTSGAVSGVGIIDLSHRDRRRVPGTDIALSEDGRRYATTMDEGVEVRDVGDQALIQRLPRLASLRLDGDGSHLIGWEDGKTSLYEVANGRRIVQVPAAPEWRFDNAAIFAPDGSAFAVCAPGQIHRYRTQDGMQLPSLATFGSRPIRCAYSSSGRYFAIMERGVRSIRRYDVTDGTHTDIAFEPWDESERGTLASVAISADGNRIAVGNWQGSVQICDVVTKRFQRFPAHAGTIWCLAFAENDPDLIFTSGGAQGVAAWDLQIRECCYQSVHDVARRLMLSRDGTTIVCQTPEGPLLIDLTYRERHIANHVAMRLDQLRSQITIAPEREAELRAWATAVQARPWPRWR